MYYNRHTIRLKGYDYSKIGMYFITICTQDRSSIFGNIENGQVKLSKIGNIAENMLLKVQRKMKNTVEINEYVIMPNHIHFILEIKVNSKICLGNFLTHYKSLVTKSINKNYDINVWQRNYYEHIIRNEKEMYLIIEYIRNNPINWKKDSLHK